MNENQRGYSLSLPHIVGEDESYKLLVEAIIERAVKDYALHKKRYMGDNPRRQVVDGFTTGPALIQFFFSDWFEELLSSISTVTPSGVRKILNIRREDYNEGYFYIPALEKLRGGETEAEAISNA